MTSGEFIDCMVGVSWVNRASSLNECDCYGLIILYFLHVHRIEVDFIEGYEDGSLSIQKGLFKKIESGEWEKSECGDGVAFMAFVTVNGVRSPGHCGIVIGGYCLHAQGYEDAEGMHGQVQCTKIEALKRLYRGDMEFYRYAG